MNEFLNAICSVCLVLIAVAFFEIIIPNEKIKQPLKLLTGAIIAASLIGIITTSEIEIENFDFDTDSANYSQQSAETAAKMVSTILNENGVNGAEITIDTSKSENGGIVFNKVTVTAENIADKRKTEDEISSLFDAEIEVLTK